MSGEVDESSSGSRPPADLTPRGVDAGLDAPESGPARRAVGRYWRRVREHTLAFLLFLGLSLLFLGPWILGRMTTWFLSAQPQDGSIFVWMLRWWPYAFAHQLNPLFTTVA